MITNIQKTLEATKLALLPIGVCIAMVTQPVPVEAADWVVGDVFTGVGNGSYKVYDNAGVLKETITDGLGGFTTGCAFNPTLDRLYTTNFSNTKVIAYNDTHPHSILQTIDTGATSPGGQSESIVFDSDGSFFVGHPDSNDLIHKYDAAGNLLMTFSAAVERRGTDWLDLAADRQTMFYTSEGSRIMRFDVVNNVQLADFANIGGFSFALRLLPPGDGSGGLLVANNTDIKRLDSTGAVVQTYDAPGEDGWFALNLDPNGTSFWSGDPVSANFYRFNIATGAIEVGPINTGTGSDTLFGLCVKGEPTAALPKVDHFKCYEAVGKAVRKTVRLEDQFGVAPRVKVKGPELFCNPVSKNEESIIDSTAHLTCYDINDGNDDKKRRVRVKNQFGEQTLKVDKPKRLCVPSEKNGVPSALNLDHFKCYKAGGKDRRKIVRLEDEFGVDPRVRVKEPELFCNPVNKNEEGIKNPSGHLACYDIDKKRHERVKNQDGEQALNLDENEDDNEKRRVRVNNQFGARTLKIDEPKLLCVPSEKISTVSDPG